MNSCYAMTVRARARKAIIGTYFWWWKNLLSMSTRAVGGRGQISWSIGKGHRQVSVSRKGDHTIGCDTHFPDTTLLSDEVSVCLGV